MLQYPCRLRQQTRANGASAFYYEYTIKDHLGNARINFRANGAAVTFLQELHYYPFGMLMEGIGTAKVTDNGYKYNGKELNEDLGLNWSDYGARWYDAALGRFLCVDPIASDFTHVTPYNYAENRVPNGIDLWGLQFIDMHSYAQKNERIKEFSDEEKIEIAEAQFESVKFVADLVAGEFIPGYDEVQSISEGDYGGALLGALPLGGLINKVSNKLDDVADVAKKIEVDDINKIDRDLLDKPNFAGQAPTFKSDGTKVELHHVGQNPEGPYKEMHWQDHRGKGNDKVNHPEKGKLSKIDRNEFAQQRKDYWIDQLNDWDKGDIPK